MITPAHGRVDPGFEAVRDVYTDLLATGAETGSALAVVHDGRLVIDLHGGWRDAGRTHEWTADTLVNTYSVSKPVIAACVLLLVDRGLIELDDSVSRHWPEFTATAVTVRHVLAHTSGLPTFPVPRRAEEIGDWDLLVTDLAAAVPQWEPGTVAAEHALTYGHLLGELVRRVTGRSAGQFLADEITRPWGLDLGIGLSPADQARCAEMAYGHPDWPVATLGESHSLRYRGLANPAGCLDLHVLNSPRWRAAQFPAVNMHATARGVARFYAGLFAGGELDGVRLFSAAIVAEALKVQYAGPDILLNRDVRWTLGMQIDEDGSWGMGGIGGSIGYAHPTHGYCFAYVTRHLADFHRVDLLADALHGCL